MQRKAAYIRPKVVGAFSGPCTNGSYVHRAALYGEIVDSVIMKDKQTTQPRGFGFVTYSNIVVVDKVIEG
jgi:heterogeneous nuclear ribonucleoprotein A1/A3